MTDKKWRVEWCKLPLAPGFWRVMEEKRCVASFDREADARSVVEAHNGRGEPVAWQWRVGRSTDDWCEWEPKTETTKAAAEAKAASFVHVQFRPLYASNTLRAALTELCEEAKDSLFDATPLQSFLDAIGRAEKALGYKPLPGRLESADAILAKLRSGDA